MDNQTFSSVNELVQYAQQHPNSQLSWNASDSNAAQQAYQQCAQQANITPATTASSSNQSSPITLSLPNGSKIQFESSSSMQTNTGRITSVSSSSSQTSK